MCHHIWMNFKPEFDSNSPQTASSQHWHARLTLHFKESHGETVMADNTHSGPLRVQRTFKVEDGSRHVYILHPPGGYVAGDVIDIKLSTEHGAHVVATSNGAAKFYRCANGHPLNQSQTLSLEAKDQSLLEWLPQETILFKNANAKLVTNIQLAEAANFIGWEISCLGRTASGEDFGDGRFDQALNLYRQDRLIHRERLNLTPGDPIQTEAWGLEGQPVFGTLIAAFCLDKNNDNDFDQQDRLMQAVAALREQLAGFYEARYWSVTTKAGIILVRYLGPQSEPCKNGFNLAREFLIKTFRQTDAARPRIWAT